MDRLCGSPPPRPFPDDGGRSAAVGPRSSRRRGAEEVPLVARDIEENGDLAIGFGARRSHERDPRRDHALVGRAEIIDLQEKADAAGELVADDALLLFAVRPGDQNPGRSTWRAYDHPALRPPVVGKRRDIFDELEAQHADEEVDGRIVLLHDESDEVQLRHQPNAPDFLSASISAAAKPASRRISSLCWPTAGGGPAFRGWAKPSRIGLFTVRGTSGLVVSAKMPAWSACSSSTTSASRPMTPKGMPVPAKVASHSA